jgi:glutathione S-transferase
MLKLYHAQNTRSLRVRWLLEELGLDYEIEKVSFMEGAHRSPDYLAVHPLGRLPAFEDAGKVLFESGAIMEWLLETHAPGKLRPEPGSQARADYLQYFHFAEGTFMVALSEIAQHAFLRPEEKRIPQVAEEAAVKASECLGVVEMALADGREHLTGPDFTAADVMLGYNLMLCKMFGLLTAESFPKTTQYYARLAERPAFAKAAAD